MERVQHTVRSGEVDVLGAAKNGVYAYIDFLRQPDTDSLSRGEYTSALALILNEYEVRVSVNKKEDVKLAMKLGRSINELPLIGTDNWTAQNRTDLVFESDNNQLVSLPLEELPKKFSVAVWAK